MGLDSITSHTHSLQSHISYTVRRSHAFGTGQYVSFKFFIQTKCAISGH